MSLSKREIERTQNRQVILTTAKKLFAQRGYENASMNQIAQQAKLTKRTIYKHFIDKADLYLSVLIEQYGELCDYLLSSKKTGNGYEMIKSSLYAYYRFYSRHTDTFKIIYDIGKVRTLTKNDKITIFLELDRKITHSFIKDIQLGQKDGSIKPDIDAVSTTHNIRFLITGFFNQLTISGKSYVKHIDNSVEQFVSEIIEMVLYPLSTSNY